MSNINDPHPENFTRKNQMNTLENFIKTVIRSERSEKTRIRQVYLSTSTKMTHTKTLRK